MATVPYTITQFNAYPHAYRISWTGLTNGDQGQPIEFLEHSDRSIQVTGTFDTSTIAFEGSNDGGTTYTTVLDASDTALSWTTADTEPKTIREITALQRPTVTAGGGSTSLNVHLLIRRNRP